MDLLSCTAQGPATLHDLRIKEFWFVHEPQNLEISLREDGDFQMIVLPFGVWVIGVAPSLVFAIQERKKKTKRPYNWRTTPVSH